MNPSDAVLVAVGFVWLGMVLAISFIEAPLKFRAPDVTLRIGLGIGRLVFRALNIVESVIACPLRLCRPGVGQGLRPRGGRHLAADEVARATAG
ncbi:hypothetical protein [Acrocarpospora phusangensis]|uniref:hypothetical protein n=1 Tax=Acrocarpospora phusangensis TaxID=1070424 RepID=UPI00194E74C6|nr:hypothetical protein [Acrocarpospora phusangensis]